MVRLIDADQFIKDMEELYRDAGWDKREVHFSLSDVRSNIDMQPAIDAAPVRHGKWIYYYEIEQGRALRCSECKMVFWVGDGREGNFCPNCGARMDEE